MKASLLIVALTCCFMGCSYAYEPSLYEAERLQTAEKLLWSVPTGMQHDIEQKLISHKDEVDNERKRFCIEYLLYQLTMIAQKSSENATTSTRTPALVTKIIDETTYVVMIDGKETTISL